MRCFSALSLPPNREEKSRIHHSNLSSSSFSTFVLFSGLKVLAPLRFPRLSSTTLPVREDRVVQEAVSGRMESAAAIDCSSAQVPRGTSPTEGRRCLSSSLNPSIRSEEADRTLQKHLRAGYN